MATSTQPPLPDAGSSTRPYLIRAMHEWCTDNGFTPYLAVFVTAQVQVPAEYVKNHEIVLNTALEATSQLKLGNDYIEFQARFGGVVRHIVVPVDNVVAIYARENGQGMAFPAPGDTAAEPVAPASGGGRHKKSPAAPRSALRLAATDGTPADHAPAAAPASAGKGDGKGERDGDGDTPPTSPPGKRPALKRIK